jgi:membrane protease YdiL (CAAX protease family)
MSATNVTVEKGGLTLVQETNQYSLWNIIGIWLAAGAPMWVLGWLIYPALSQNLSAVDAGLLRIKLITLGLVWQFVLSMVILYREEGNIRPATIARRFRLSHPVSPKTGVTSKRLWWWIIPLILLVALVEIAFKPAIVNLWTTIFPFFAEPKGYDLSNLLTPELRAQWVGAWGLLGLFFVQALFNTFLGEEFIFRGVLLPKMEGVFGKWDWVANAVLFGFYHLHQPWGILDSIVTGLIFAFTAKRFRSTWFPIIFLILGLVLGLA